MKQKRIEITLSSPSFEDTYFDTEKSKENPHLLYDVCKAFTWAFQVPTDRSMAVRSINIVDIEDDDLEKNPPKYIPETKSNDDKN